LTCLHESFPNFAPSAFHQHRLGTDTMSTTIGAKTTPSDDGGDEDDEDMTSHSRKRLAAGNLDESALHEDEKQKLESRRAYNRQCAAKGTFDTPLVCPRRCAALEQFAADGPLSLSPSLIH
jgi:hypothetical protein